MGLRQPWVARRRQVVSAFQVGVSSAKKRSYSVGERGLPGVKVEIESWAGVADGGRNNTAERGINEWMDRTPKPSLAWDRPRLGSGAPCKLETGEGPGAMGMTGTEIEVSPWQMGEELSQKLGSMSNVTSVRRFRNNKGRILWR